MPTATANPYTLLNEKNRAFWCRENELLTQRLQNPHLVRLWEREVRNEQLRGVPLRNQKSMSQALADAQSIQRYFEEETRKSFGVEFARKGGRAPKSDRLQKLVLSIVRRNAQITEAELLRIVLRTNGFEREGEYIAFDKGNGTEKHAPINALKDRLYRAKKKLNSR